jgi:hypothetical protein
MNEAETRPVKTVPITHCARSFFRGHARVWIGRSRHGLFGCELALRKQPDSRGNDEGAVRAGQRRPQSFHGLALVFAILLEFRKVVVEAGVNQAIGSTGSGAQTVQVQKVAAMDRGASGG